MNTVKVLVPKEAAEFIKGISDLNSCSMNIYTLNETFYEGEDGVLYMVKELIEPPNEQSDYDLPMDWEPNYNGTTPEERRDEAIKQQKLK